MVQNQVIPPADYVNTVDIRLIFDQTHWLFVSGAPRMPASGQYGCQMPGCRKQYTGSNQVGISPMQVNYRQVSNTRCTSNIRRTPTFGNSHLEFSKTISLAKTSNTRCTLSFDPECRLLTMCEVNPRQDPHGSSCSEWPEILTHCGLQEQWHLISLGHMRDILHWHLLRSFVTQVQS